jgi:hypothetical protein
VHADLQLMDSGNLAAMRLTRSPVIDSSFDRSPSNQRKYPAAFGVSK